MHDGFMRFPGESGFARVMKSELNSICGLSFSSIITVDEVLDDVVIVCVMATKDGFAPRFSCGLARARWMDMPERMSKRAKAAALKTTITTVITTKVLLTLSLPIDEESDAVTGARTTVERFTSGGRAGSVSVGAIVTSALTFRLSDGSCAAKPAAMAPPPSVCARLLWVSVIVIVTERAVSSTETTVTPRLATPAIIFSEDEALRLVCDALAA